MKTSRSERSERSYAPLAAKLVIRKLTGILGRELRAGRAVLSLTLTAGGKPSEAEILRGLERLGSKLPVSATLLAVVSNDGVSARPHGHVLLIGAPPDFDAVETYRSAWRWAGRPSPDAQHVRPLGPRDLRRVLAHHFDRASTHGRIVAPRGPLAASLRAVLDLPAPETGPKAKRVPEADAVSTGLSHSSPHRPDGTCAWCTEPLAGRVKRGHAQYHRLCRQSASRVLRRLAPGDAATVRSWVSAGWAVRDAVRTVEYQGRRCICGEPLKSTRLSVKTCGRAACRMRAHRERVPRTDGPRWDHARPRRDRAVDTSERSGASACDSAVDTSEPAARARGDSTVYTSDAVDVSQAAPRPDRRSGPEVDPAEIETSDDAEVIP